jgi:signal transduction histidine kinase
VGLEILLDTVAYTLRVPLRVLRCADLQACCEKTGELPAFIESYGSWPALRQDIGGIVKDPIAGIKLIEKNQEFWTKPVSAYREAFARDRLRRFALARPTILASDLLNRCETASLALGRILQKSQQTACGARRLVNLALQELNTGASQTEAPFFAQPALVEELYGFGRNNYMRERIQLIRLWLRDNFARWITILNLSENKKFTEMVDRLAGLAVQVFEADRCSIYRYDAERRELSRLGCAGIDALEPQDAERVRGVELVKETGRDPRLRQRSLRYRSIDDALCKIVSHARPEEAEPDEIGRPPLSRMIVPIILFDRPWGLLEIEGYRDEQFLDSTRFWLEDLARLIMPHLYYEWFLAKLHELDKAIVNDDNVNRPRDYLTDEEIEEDKKRKYKALTSTLAAFFVASSAALYLRHSSRLDEYVCVAQVGRPVTEKGELCGFSRTDEHSRSVDALTALRWMKGRIGEPPFAGEWLQKEKIRALWEDGHRFIAIVPIRNSTGVAVGSFTLTAREGRGFGDGLEHLVEFAAQYAGVVVESIGLQHRNENFAREYAAHTVKTRVDRVYGAATKFDRQLSTFFGEAGDAALVGEFVDGVEILASRHRIPLGSISREATRVMTALRAAFGRESSNSFGLILSDLREHLPDLRMAAATLSGAANDENPYESTWETWDGTPSKLRSCLLSCIKPLSAERHSAIRAPSPSELSLDVAIQAPAAILREIINNFIDNALKYRVSGTDVIVRFREFPDGPAILEFRNLAPPLAGDERVRLFERGFRAAYARQLQKDGQGRGLAFNRLFARRWHMDIEHHQEELRNSQSNQVWHVFRLVIPRRNIADGFFQPTREGG